MSNVLESHQHWSQSQNLIFKNERIIVHQTHNFAPQQMLAIKFNYGDVLQDIIMVKRKLYNELSTSLDKNHLITAYVAAKHFCNTTKFNDSITWQNKLELFEQKWQSMCTDIEEKELDVAKFKEAVIWTKRNMTRYNKQAKKRNRLVRMMDENMGTNIIHYKTILRIKEKMDENIQQYIQKEKKKALKEQRNEIQKSMAIIAPLILNEFGTTAEYERFLEANKYGKEKKLKYNLTYPRWPTSKVSVIFLVLFCFVL